MLETKGKAENRVPPLIQMLLQVSKHLLHTYAQNATASLSPTAPGTTYTEPENTTTFQGANAQEIHNTALKLVFAP